jgi:hypothetical protein
VQVWKNFKVYFKWGHHLISIRLYFIFPHVVVWGRYCACEILIANPIDWLYAACLEYSIFSRSTVQKLENNMMNFLSIMQTIIYAHDRAHFQGTGWLWFRRMELIEVKSLIWAQKGKLYIIYKNVMWIFGILRFKSIHLLFYTFIHMYILHGPCYLSYWISWSSMS